MERLPRRGGLVREAKPKIYRKQAGETARPHLQWLNEDSLCAAFWTAARDDSSAKTIAVWGPRPAVARRGVAKRVRVSHFGTFRAGINGV